MILDKFPRCALVKSEGRPQAAFDFIFREPGTDASETCRLLILIHRRLRRYLHLPRRGKIHCAKRNFTFHSANGRISLRAALIFSIGETGRKYARKMAGGEGILAVGISTKSGKRLDME